MPAFLLEKSPKFFVVVVGQQKQNRSLAEIPLNTQNEPPLI